MKWPQVNISTSDGPQSAVAPCVISASRSTDIPAFHARWLLDRLIAGYCKWINPFNGRPQYVSFQKCRAMVFWTKNAAPMIPVLPELDERNIAYYFQFTVNDYETEGWEPNVPPLDQRLETFKSLSRRLGPERVVWRFDPLILSDTLAVPDILAKVERIGRELHPYTKKLVLSFVDISRYGKVRKNLLRSGIRLREFQPSEMCVCAEGLASMAKSWGLTVSTCGEAMDLSEFGVSHNRCIDADLLLRISQNNDELRQAFGSRRGSVVDLCEISEIDHQKLKDRGQRDDCGCAVSKDIGQYNTCAHLCTYCYANTSAKIVLSNIANTVAGSQSILPDIQRSPRSKS